jgi:hypothetical protein
MLNGEPPFPCSWDAARAAWQAREEIIEHMRRGIEALQAELKATRAQVYEAQEQSAAPRERPAKVRFRCEDCGHEQDVSVTYDPDGARYFGSGAHWCDKCETGKPNEIKQPAAPALSMSLPALPLIKYDDHPTFNQDGIGWSQEEIEAINEYAALAVAAERERADKWLSLWSDVCNENQVLINALKRSEPFVEGAVKKAQKAFDDCDESGLFDAMKCAEGTLEQLREAIRKKT